MRRRTWRRLAAIGVLLVLGAVPAAAAERPMAPLGGLQGRLEAGWAWIEEVLFGPARPAELQEKSSEEPGDQLVPVEGPGVTPGPLTTSTAECTEECGSSEFGAEGDANG